MKLLIGIAIGILSASITMAVIAVIAEEWRTFNIVWFAFNAGVVWYIFAGLPLQNWVNRK